MIANLCLWEVMALSEGVKWEPMICLEVILAVGGCSKGAQRVWRPRIRGSSGDEDLVGSRNS